MLYMVLLGGNHPMAKIEVHDVVFINCDDIHRSHDKLRELWFGDKNRVHIDSWMAVHGVDGYRIDLSNHLPENDGLNLYFVNLGGYVPERFGEEHRYVLLVAESKDQAKLKAKQAISNIWDKPHKDNLLDIDDCLRIDNVEGFYVKLTKIGHEPNVFKNDYIVL
ncbi:DUF1543 domain-containing protein [Rheinheimera fenheensis]|uniref:DUF1543 domain-containing protein n=1 Tax=Rheinheimera fenheensis TaxID=3152295 RepID=UPI003261CE2A